MSTLDEDTAKMLEVVDRYPDTGAASAASADEQDQQPDTGAADADTATMRELLNRYDELRWAVSELRDCVERLRKDVDKLRWLVLP
jgi:hypothetical protein